MAIKTKAQLASESASTFVDNSTGLITPSLHRTYNTDTIDSFLSVKDASELQAVMLENRANSIASGTTVDLSGANGNLVHITGTSTITSFGSVQAGARFVLVFDGILLLTYNATSLILPTSANITTAVGDTAFMISEGSGNWRCVAYQRASGAALVGGGGGGSGTVTSVALTMPSAFSVANSPVTISGSLDVTATGTASQYIRGDGVLATLPSGGGGGSSVNYYLNGSITSSNPSYKQLSKVPVIGAGTDFSITGNGLLQQFLTDANDPNRLLIPAGAWNFEMWFNMSSVGGSAKFYVDLLRYIDSGTIISIASGSTNPEAITGGTSTDLYLTSIAVPETVLGPTDRLIVRVYIVDNSGGRTATLHTEDGNLCQVVTSFAGGISALNGLTGQTQYFATGFDSVSGDWFIDSTGDTHVFNIPSAGAITRGLLSAADWVTFDNKYDNPLGTTSQYIRGDGTFAALPCEIQLAASDETTALTAGTNKMTFRMPYAMTLTGIRASLTTAQASGASLLTVDVNQNGTTILSTKLIFDNTEKSTVTATTQPVISTSTLTDDAEITIDIDQIGTSGAAGLKLTLKGTRS